MFQKPKKIYFVHYGIGWKDGVNVSINNLIEPILQSRKDIEIHLVGGDIKKDFFPKGVFYHKISELLPFKRKSLSKNVILRKARVIAQKLEDLTGKEGKVIIENPFLGDYHISAMMGFILYAEKRGRDVFFRVHDLYKNSVKYNSFEKIFSKKELRSFLKSRGVDLFFVPKKKRKKELENLGISSTKIKYLANGINFKNFLLPLTKEEQEILYKKVLGKYYQKAKYKIILYPVRVVPRKNIEEAIFLVDCLRKINKENYCLVVCGKIDVHDPCSLNYYRHLKKLTAIVDFPVIFLRGRFPTKREIGLSGKIITYGMGDLYQISEAVIMTSIEEGFGYPYLETWASKKFLLGRKISDVISDFEGRGLKFFYLYSKISGFGKGYEKKEYSKRIETIARILKDKKLEKEVISSQKKIFLQAEYLRNKTKREKIITHNLAKTKKYFSSEAIVKKFLKLIKI